MAFPNSQPQDIMAAMPIGDDPPKKKAVFTSQVQIDQANTFLRDLLRRQGVDETQIMNTYAGRNIGDAIPEFVTNGQQNTTPRATNLPSGVTINDVVSSQQGYGYFHPQEGTWIPVDISAVTQRYGQNKSSNALMLAKNK